MGCLWHAAVLFHSMNVDGELEKNSLHAACPVIKGEKWSAPKWYVRLRAWPSPFLRASV
jgi:hypothetical protein